MLYPSISYLIFFPIVLLTYWLSPPGRFRQLVLLAASYFFYMSWIPQYGLLLLVLTTVNYLFGLGIHAWRYKPWARSIFFLGITSNLLCLAYYKYADFFLENFCALLSSLGMQISVFRALESSSQNIILPLAISFFTFEFIHYLYDIHKKADTPINDPLEFFLFAAFFPSQIAGPIKRYQDFIGKIRQNPSFDSERFNSGLALVIQGLFKKVAIADNLAVIANHGFTQHQSLGGVESWITVMAFTMQIYFDFSGYTDMGRGSSRMLGIELPKNFNLPYLASDIADFWKRWHISLSSWLKDYLYIPLGGNKCSKPRKEFNLLVTMLLGGLWHGAAWHFVLWGAAHGMGLIIFHRYRDLVKKLTRLQRFHQTVPGKIVSTSSTLIFVAMTWVLFRAETVPQAFSILSQMIFLNQSSDLFALEEVLVSSIAPYSLGLYLVYAMLFTPKLAAFRPVLIDKVRDRILSRPSVRIPCYAGACVAAIGLAAPQTTSFIYFQF